MLKQTPNPKIQRFAFSTDHGAGDRARIGLLVLESDLAMEAEFRVLTDLPGIAIYHARLANDAVVTPDSLAKMEGQLPIAAGLLPEYLDLTAIGYGCTSASTIIGEDRVSAILNESHPGVPSTNPMTAAKAALSRLGARRIALLTPYSPAVTEAMQAEFNAAGVEVAVVGSFYEESDAVVGKIEPQSILAAATEIGGGDECDGVFISCTSLRAAGIIEEAERALGKPVTASNHALAWHLLRLSGIEDGQEGFGRLMRLGLSEV